MLSIETLIFIVEAAGVAFEYTSDCAQSEPTNNCATEPPKVQ